MKQKKRNNAQHRDFKYNFIKLYYQTISDEKKQFDFL